MMIYKGIHLVYFSPTHTSQIVAESIAEGLGNASVEVTDLTYEAPESPLTIREKLTVIVVPVYGGRVAEIAAERLSGIRGEKSPAVLVVVYGNRDYEDALLELKDIAGRAGFIPVAGAAFIGEHSYSRKDKPIAASRPDVSDRMIALKFGQRVAEILNQNQESAALQVKGNFPYKVKGPKTPATPVTVEELCTQCGYCIDICPTQAISLEIEIASDPESCIKCCACVKECPNQARIFDTPYTDMLFTHFSARKEPELFF